VAAQLRTSQVVLGSIKLELYVCAVHTDARSELSAVDVIMMIVKVSEQKIILLFLLMESHTLCCSVLLVISQFYHKFVISSLTVLTALTHAARGKDGMRQCSG
jgi:hypothetical protein